MKKDQIGTQEFFAIVSFLIATKATDITNALLYEKTLNATWMVVIGSFLIFLPSLLFLNAVLKKSQNKDLLEVMELAFGKSFTFLLGFVLFLIILIATAVDSRSYIDQLIIMNFPKTPLFVLYLFFLLICLWGAKKGWESIGSVAWMVFPYIFTALFFLIFLVLTQEPFHRIFPLFGSGFMDVAKTSFSYVSIYGDTFVIAIMYPYVKDHKTYTKGLFGSLLFSVFVMVMLYISYTLAFDFRSISKIIYPFNEAARLVHIGMAITNIETFFLTFWLLVIIVKFAVYLYVLSKIFGFLFHIKEFEHTLIPMTILVLILGMIPENPIDDVFVIRNQMLLYSKYFFLAIPPLLWFTLKMRGAEPT